jgi:hypothetical protein
MNVVTAQQVGAYGSMGFLMMSNCERKRRAAAMWITGRFVAIYLNVEEA